MALVKIPENQRTYGKHNEKEDGTNHLNVELFVDKDAICRGIGWQKPADVDLLIQLHMEVDPDNPGPIITLVNSPGADAKTEGMAGAGRPLDAQDGSKGSKITITTSNGSAGDKIISARFSPACVGV